MPKILYIAGLGRSGTTILANLLGQVPEWASIGELHNVWHALIDDRPCGCGEKLRDCAVWQRALDAGFGELDNADLLRAREANTVCRTRNIRQILRMRRDGRMMADCEYAPFMKGLYDGLVAATGARVIVDSTKDPAHALVAAELTDYEVYVLHIVRDPRGVAYSWKQRRKGEPAQGGGALTWKFSYVGSTVMWQVDNTLLARQVRSAVGQDRYLRLQYEAFAAQPKLVLDEILEFVGEPTAPRPVIDGDVFEMEPTHTASGNHNRFTTGQTQIRLDTRWRSVMPRRSILAISMLAYPTLRSMGYHWWR